MATPTCPGDERDRLGCVLDVDHRGGHMPPELPDPDGSNLLPIPGHFLHPDPRED